MILKQISQQFCEVTKSNLLDIFSCFIIKILELIGRIFSNLEFEYK